MLVYLVTPVMALVGAGEVLAVASCVCAARALYVKKCDCMGFIVTLFHFDTPTQGDITMMT